MSKVTNEADLLKPFVFSKADNKRLKLAKELTMTDVTPKTFAALGYYVAIFLTCWFMVGFPGWAYMGIGIVLLIVSMAAELWSNFRWDMAGEDAIEAYIQLIEVRGQMECYNERVKNIARRIRHGRSAESLLSEGGRGERLREKQQDLIEEFASATSRAGYWTELNRQTGLRLSDLWS